MEIYNLKNKVGFLKEVAELEYDEWALFKIIIEKSKLKIK